MSDDDLAGLEIPETPAGVPYRDREDAFALALLEVNGKPSDDAAVLALLDARSELFAGAAARLTGARGLTEAIPRLRDLAASPTTCSLCTPPPGSRGWTRRPAARS